MNVYIKQFKDQLADYQTKCADKAPVPVLELLWQCYFQSNTVDDGLIRQAELTIQHVFETLPVENSDVLFDMIGDLITAYQRAAFLEGIQIGAHLVDALEKNAPPFCANS